MFDDPAFGTGGHVVEEPSWPADDPGPSEPDPDEPHPERNGHRVTVVERSDSGDVDWRERAVEVELAKLRIRTEARRRLDDENRPPIKHRPAKNLDTLLSEPDTETQYRIADVAPDEARIILSAQYKGGKTSLVNNVMRSLADSDPFLGRFTVNKPANGLVLIDNEMSENTLRRWLRSQHIANTAAVVDVVTLRGKVATFNLIDDRCRAAWAQRLRDVGCDYLVLDCLRPVLDALGLDENRDAGRFLVAFDALLAEADIGDALLVQHMGHGSERARGDSRMQDWPDAIWRLIREDDNPDSPRYFTAYGRDVDVREGRLSFDPSTRRLTYAPGSRTDAKAEAAQLAVVEILALGAKVGDDPLSKRSIAEALTGEHSQKAIRDGITLAVEHGFVTVTGGSRRAQLHSIAYPCSECGMPVASKQERHLSCPSGPDGLFI
jgi:hypothetical protein